jgi:SAM-dependent methyltransferase
MKTTKPSFSDALSTYFIKPGYRINSVAHTLEGEQAGSYWTEQRMQASRSYQYEVYRLVQRLARKRRCSTLLDVGCGTAIKVAMLLANVVSRITLMDQPTCREMAQRILPTARFISADLETIDIRLEEKFDLIVCSDVVEHLLNPLPCLDFIRRHLSLHGLAIFSTPERDTLRGPDCNECVQPAHVREWNYGEFRRLLLANGYAVRRQFLVPPARLSVAEALLCRSLGWALKRPEWHACQVAICTSGAS